MKTMNLDSSVGIGGDNCRDDILSVQKALNQLSEHIGLAEPLAEDGDLGADPSNSKTCAAIKQFQSQILGFKNPDCRIDPDGKSHRALNESLTRNDSTPVYDLFLPHANPEKGLTLGDFQAAADELNCEVAAIQAVSEVESAGNGFFSSGLPVILFEAHQFSKYSDHRFDESHPNISTRRWDRSLYLGGEKEYDRLKEAMELDRCAALKSASYGRYQIMGFNHRASGYDSVETFVHDMCLAESNHLMAFVSFIKSDSRLFKAIQTRDWATFARYYNGPAYAQNRYDEKLQAGYEKYRA